MWSNYIDADSIDEALEALNTKKEKARIVAGATDLLLEIERGLWPEVDTLVDVSRVSFRNPIYVDDDGFVHLSPTVTHNQCLASRIIREKAPLLSQAVWEIGSPQIRNRGTIAGNLATGSPANDTITPLMALNAVLTLSNASGNRDIALDEFYTGVRRNVMDADEMITGIKFKALEDSYKSIFLKCALRNAQAISLVNVAMVLNIEDNAIKEVQITLGAVAPTIIHATQTENYIQGKKIDQLNLNDLAEKISNEAKPIDDIRGSANFRKEMVRVLAKKGLKIILYNEEYDPLPANPVKLSTSKEFSEHRPAEKIFKGSSIQTIINGKPYEFNEGIKKSLLRLIREDAGLIGSKEGCAEGECGACTLFLDGDAVMSCMVPAPRAHGAIIETIESVAKNGKLHPVQESFIEEGAVQCGYCTPGFIMSGVKLLEEVEYPSDGQIKEAFAGNLCRCTGYYKIIKSIESATVKLKND